MSILAISGRKSSGKDVVGKIIEYLTSEANVYPFDLNIDYSHKSNWEVKKFADKLKDIICILINCTREQLEDESFKSKELGEEWWYWYMERDGGYSPIILDYLTTTKKELKNYEGLELIKPTIRFLLQFIGTDLLRNQLHPQIWVNSLMSEYKSIGGYYSSNLRIGARFYDENGNLQKEIIGKEIPNTEIDKRVYPNWLITDVRFQNEADAIKERGGKLIKVIRYKVGDKVWFNDEAGLYEDKNQSGEYEIIGIHSNEEYLISNGTTEMGAWNYEINHINKDTHVSEVEQDSIPVYYIIHNSTTLEDLIESVKYIMIEEGVIKV